MASFLLARSLIADAPIAQFKVVKFGTDSSHGAQATGPTDSLIGICGSTAPAAGERFDLTVVGIERCTAGAAFAAGALLTSDANGNVVAATPNAGVNNRIVGVAWTAANALGDVVEVLLNQGSVQG